MSEEGRTQGYDPNIILDAANGVGALKVVPLQERLEGLLIIELVNSGDGELNKEVMKTAVHQLMQNS